MLDTAVKIVPFAVMTSCPKCGEEDQSWSRDGVVQQKICVLASRYCPGGKEPEASLEDSTVHNVIAPMTGGAVIFPQRTPKINICAGLGEEHLHRICNNCGYEFLMACQDVHVPGAALIPRGSEVIG